MHGLLQGRMQTGQERGVQMKISLQASFMFALNLASLFLLVLLWPLESFISLN